MRKTEILIIGGGLTGLTLNYLLRRSGKEVVVVEARGRSGGRIQTIQTPTGASIEMGATWLGEKHTALTGLLEELGIETFPQILGAHAIYEWISTSPAQLVDLPKNEEPSYRIRGGTSSLIRKLAGFLDDTSLCLGQAVQGISTMGDRIQATTRDEVFEADLVVSTLPPYLLRERVEISPSLPQELEQLMAQTHTWMGESIKIGLVFKRPFWRDADTSGTVFSNVGPISELYDHSDFHNSTFALKGFFNPTYYGLTEAQRLAMTLNQLKKYYGEVSQAFESYHETVWADEKYTFAPYRSHLLPHQNNGHEMYQKSYLDGRLYIAGSETAPLFPGYMEGAVRSAASVYNQIKRRV